VKLKCSWTFVDFGEGKVDINSLIENRFGLPTEVGKSVEGSRTVTDILSRRSCRKFLVDEVPKDLLDTLLATAFSAPSKSDLQQASVIYVRDPEKKLRIAHASSKTRWVAEAPVFLVWCGDSRRIRKVSEWRGHPFANDHLDAFLNSSVDAAICMQTFLIAAESIGLGCCPVSEIRDNIQLLSDELELPEHVFPVAGLCVGWPSKQSRVSMRLPLPTTVTIDGYHENNLIEEISAYDERREAEEPTSEANQRDVDQFGVSATYGWSENRTRQYAQPARADFGEYIRKQGFNLS